ncbi:MAG: hypothetical protein LC687_01475 [Actinobacteria bacterium]|nr:hypothetical protein [Actinomycetota bacterium]
MRDPLVGTHKGTPTLTAFDPIKDKPGTEAYNAVSGPQNTVRAASPKRVTTDGSYKPAPAQVPGAFASVVQPSLPRRDYVPTVTL